MSIIVLKVIGFVLTIPLLVESLGFESSIIEKVCGNKKQEKGCRMVLKTKYAHLFSWLSLAEIGGLYFFASLLILLLINATGKQAYFSIIVITNALAIPLSLVSIYYQWFIIKEWCRLCVSIQVVLWIEFAVFIFFLPDFYVIGFDLFWLLGWFIIPTFIWFLIKPLILKNREALQLKQQLNLFVKDLNVFKFLLQKEKCIAENILEGEITIGNPEASVSLLFVINPFCEPCAELHRKLDDIIQLLEDDLIVKIRFIEYSQIAEYIILLAQDYPIKAFQALNDWYKIGDKQEIKEIDKWKKKYPIRSNTYEHAQKLLALQDKWCIENDIDTTPTIFINGCRYPNHLKYSDLPYLLWRYVYSN